MSLSKIEKAFACMDTYYLELYDKQKQFDKKNTAKNKKELETTIQRFKKYLYIYETSVKNVWISEKWGGM